MEKVYHVWVLNPGGNEEDHFQFQSYVELLGNLQRVLLKWNHEIVFEDYTIQIEYGTRSIGRGALA